MAVALLIRWMKRTEPNAKPVTMASVRSRKMVRKKVAASTVTSPQPDRTRIAMAGFSIMFQATTARTPASAASGMYEASGAATIMKSRRKRACSIPETGPCAPARTFVAVLAIVPVTQNPPKSAAPILATPCATSSQFERCRRPVMPSATTADRSDSMAPKSVNEMAAGSTAATFSTDRFGRLGAGKDEGMPPNLVPMVCAGRDRRTVARDATPTAISMPGQSGASGASPEWSPPSPPKPATLPA